MMVDGNNLSNKDGMVVTIMRICKCGDDVNSSREENQKEKQLGDACHGGWLQSNVSDYLYLYLRINYQEGDSTNST
jgi:hypothetical protein